MKMNQLYLTTLIILGSHTFLQAMKHMACSKKDTTKHHRVEKQQQWKAMAAEVDSWTDALGLGIDSKIKDTVIVLNLLGFKTAQSCEGHLDQGLAHPWVSFDIEDTEIQALRNKYRDSRNAEDVLRQQREALDPEDTKKREAITSELNASYKQSNAISTEIDQLEHKKIAKLQDLITTFYKTHKHNSYDRILHLSPMVGFRLESIGGQWQIIQTSEMKKQKLKEYQDEMQLFTNFLIDYFFKNSASK